MSYSIQDAPGYRAPVAALPVQVRAQFITRTYNHLFGAIAAFAALEFYLFQSGLAETIARAMLGGSWLIVLGGFMVASWVATHFAHNAQTRTGQYLALGGFVVAEAIVFVPLLFVANAVAPGVIQSAGIVTMLGFAGLTAVAFVTKRDFSFLRSFLMWAGIVAMVAIVASLLFGFQLGTLFSVAMVGLAGASVLYDTSNVLHHYPADRHVGAALQLFASVAMMFWYVIRLLMSLQRD